MGAQVATLDRTRIARGKPSGRLPRTGVHTPRFTRAPAFRRAGSTIRSLVCCAALRQGVWDPHGARGEAAQRDFALDCGCRGSPRHPSSAGPSPRESQGRQSDSAPLPALPGKKAREPRVVLCDPAYELADGNLDLTADLQAFGSALWQLVRGKALRPELPTDLERVLTKLLHPTKRLRYSGTEGTDRRSLPFAPTPEPRPDEATRVFCRPKGRTGATP